MNDHRPGARIEGVRITRRVLLGQTLGFGAALLAACSSPPPAAPSKPAAQPTTAPVPTAAAQPAAAAKPTDAPAAAKPAEAAKPAAPAATKPADDAGMLRSTEPNPKRGGVATYAWNVATNHFDFHQGSGAVNVLWHTYSNLVQLNPMDGLKTIVPDLAQSWEVSPDGKVYTFKLRPGVKWHDGTDFTADDVLATFNRIINPPAGMVSVFKARFGALQGVEAPDKMTVRMTLAAPRAYFLEVLANGQSIIYSKKAIEENGGDLKKVIAPGTGAYVFKDHKAGEKWTLERNPNYWNKDLPYIDTLEFIHAPQWSDRGTAILSNQADMSWNVSKETFAEGQARSNEIGTYAVPATGAYMIYFNAAKKPFDDARVRRALHLALNRQDLFEAFTTQEPLNYTRYMSHGFEFATPPDEVLKLPGYRADKAEDVAQAKQLLQQAGLADGVKGLQILTASVGPHAQTLTPATQAILKSSLGVESEIRAVERAVLNDEMKNGQWDLCLNTIELVFYDPSLGWTDYFSTNGPNNYGKYSNPKLDEMLKKLDDEQDQSKRKDMFREIEDLLDQESPWMTIGFTNHLHMWKKYLKGMPFERVRLLWGRTETLWVDK